MDEKSIMFANEAFYLAFSNREFGAMDRVWARSEPLICIHPGWPALTDRSAIMDSWKSIFTNPNTPKIKPRNAQVFLANGLAVVVCYEEIQSSVLVATNLFKMEQNQICILHHQAGPCANPPRVEIEQSSELH